MLRIARPDKGPRRAQGLTVPGAVRHKAELSLPRPGGQRVGEQGCYYAPLAEGQLGSRELRAEICKPAWKIGLSDNLGLMNLPQG